MNEYIDKKVADNALTAAAVADSDKKRRTWAKVIGVLHDIPAADVVPVIHGTPISKIRPQKYEIYEQAGTGENGEILYHKRIYVDEKNSAEYCPVCNKRLCSRFRSFCPNCGAKMDLEEDK